LSVALGTLAAGGVAGVVAAGGEAGGVAAGGGEAGGWTVSTLPGAGAALAADAPQSSAIAATPAINSRIHISHKLTN
jgi:hypothetical protein